MSGSRRAHIAPIRRGALLGVMLVAALPGAHLAQAESSPRCFGLVPTILGTYKRDHLVGTMGDDVIMGLGGRDQISAKGGDDTICGGPHREPLSEYGDGVGIIHSGPGHDRVRGGSGNDDVYGGEGQDFIDGKGGGDGLYGGPGSDTILIGEHGYYAVGGRGNDLIRGGSGTDYAIGGPGADRAYGGPGDDFLASAITHTSQPFYFLRRRGGGGNDVHIGGAGNDTFGLGRGRDIEIGGPGRDQLVARNPSSDRSLLIDLGRGSARGLGSDILKGIEDAYAVSWGEITIVGTDSPNRIAIRGSRLGMGPTLIKGAGAGDLIYLIPGRARSGEMQRLLGGDGNDHLVAGCFKWKMPLFFSGGSGKDRIRSLCASDIMFGGAGTDLLKAGTYSDKLFGMTGRDFLMGGAGIDQLSGGHGPDVCDGGEWHLACDVANPGPLAWLLIEKAPSDRRGRVAKLLDVSDLHRIPPWIR